MLTTAAVSGDHARWTITPSFRGSSTALGITRCSEGIYKRTTFSRMLFQLAMPNADGSFRVTTQPQSLCLSSLSL